MSVLTLTLLPLDCDDAVDRPPIFDMTELMLEDTEPFRLPRTRTFDM